MGQCANSDKFRIYCYLHWQIDTLLKTKLKIYPKY